MKFPTGGAVARVRDELDVGQLVGELRREGRDRPMAVLTIAPGRNTPYVDPQLLLRDGVDVVVIPTDALTRRFAQRLDDERDGVFGGACRVYPPGLQWGGFKRHLVNSTAQIRDLRRLLVADLDRALEQAERARQAEATARVAPAGASDGPRDHATKPPAAVRTDADAQALAAHLRSPDRRLPVVVVSRATGAPEAFADVAELETKLDGIADVVEIVEVAASWEFSRAMPDRCQVYGGAGRVYPTGVGWEADPYEAPLRFAHGMTDRTRVTVALIRDAMGMAARGGGSFSSPKAVRRRITGEVVGIVGGSALVRVGGETMPAACWPDLVEPGVPAERMFRKGMRVEGEMDMTSRRVDVRSMRQEPGAVLEGARSGETLLARVARVDREDCSLEFFPGVVREVGADAVADDVADLRLLLSVDDVVPVMLVARDGDDWLLSLADAADVDEASPAPSILAGGPPWLVSVAAQDAPADEPVAPSGSPAPGGGLEDAWRREHDQLVARIQELERKLAAAQEANARQREALREEKRRNRARTRPSEAADRLFSSEEEQLRFEVHDHWARTVPAGEKADQQLAPYRFGEGFLASLAEVQGVSRGKVVKVMVQVLTGVHRSMASRELHQLREGRGGDDRPVVRGNGETCWRVSLQTNTASARRLHYWDCADGAVEFSAIRLHDDFRP